MTDRKSVSDLISKLADKTLSFGCIVQWKGNMINGEQRSVRVGNVTKIPGSKRTEIITEEGFCWEKKNIEILGHPILIGDFLEKMKLQLFDKPKKDDPKANIGDLISFWVMCDMSKSLQTIIEESGWEEIEINKCTCGQCCGEHPLHTKIIEQLKDPNARALVEFLLTVFK